MSNRVEYARSRIAPLNELWLGLPVNPEFLRVAGRRFVNITTMRASDIREQSST